MNPIVITPEIALETLKEAIELVKPEFILSETIRNQDIEETDTMKAQTERCFAYELYHQWRNILDSSKYVPIKINSEITKEIDPTFFFNDETEASKKFPDIVLHGGQNDVNNQIMICEIKRHKLHSLKDRQEDFIKLRRYLNLYITSNNGEDILTDARFKKAAFIMTNCSINELEKAVRDVFTTEFKVRNNFSAEDIAKIECIACEIIKDDESRYVKAISKPLSEILESMAQ